MKKLIISLILIIFSLSSSAGKLELNGEKYIVLKESKEVCGEPGGPIYAVNIMLLNEYV